MPSSIAVLRGSASRKVSRFDILLLLYKVLGAGGMRLKG